jgi:L-threonylcarbamoyladenylate synthase
MPNSQDSKAGATNDAVLAAADAPETIPRAARLLRDGRLVAFPTETVYGLGADAANSRAVAAIFAAKGRPAFNPLIVHCATSRAAFALGHFNEAARQLAAAFWPGPLTIVVPRRDGCGIADLVSAGLPTLALRVPAHPVAQSLLREFGGAIAAPSANRSGRLSATTAAHVAADLKPYGVAMIIDAGPAAHGVESTIIDATRRQPVILRPGAIPRDAVAGVISLAKTSPQSQAASKRPSAPGQLDSHYAPKANLRLNARSVEPGEALLAFGAALPTSPGAVFNLSADGDLVEAAANLFAALRALDATGATTIAVMPIPDEGLGEAINDRLRRAAAPRP